MFIHYLTMLEADRCDRGVSRNHCTSAARAVILENADITFTIIYFQQILEKR